MKSNRDSRWWIQIGADRSAANLLEHVRAVGYETLVFDLDANAPGAKHATRLMTRAPEDLVAIEADVRALARDAEIAGCATLARDADSLRATASIRSHFDLPGISIEEMESLLDRGSWKKALSDAGILTPEVDVLESPTELDRFLGVHPSALLKPASGGRGSQGVARVRVGDPRNRELFDEARTISDSDLVRVEAFVPGEEFSVDGVIRAGRLEIIHLGRQFSMRNLRGTLPTGTAWGSPVAGRRADDDPRWTDACELGQRVADALRLDDCFIGFGIMDDGESTHVIDVRPHLGRAVDRAIGLSGIDFNELACDIAVGERRDRALDAGKQTIGFAQRFFYANALGVLDGPGQGASESSWRTLPVTRAPDAPPEINTQAVFWDKLLGDSVGRPRSAVDRVASLVVAAEDRNAAWMHANEIDPDTLYQVREARVEPTTTHPLWPMPPVRG